MQSVEMNDGVELLVEIGNTLCMPYLRQDQVSACCTLLRDNTSVGCCTLFPMGKYQTPGGTWEFGDFILQVYADRYTLSVVVDGEERRVQLTQAQYDRAAQDAALMRALEG